MHHFQTTHLRINSRQMTTAAEHILKTFCGIFKKKMEDLLFFHENFLCKDLISMHNHRKYQKFCLSFASANLQMDPAMQTSFRVNATDKHV